MNHDLLRYWPLDPDVTYLNHGSFGACPWPVLRVQDEWRARLEREPVQFMDTELEGQLDRARARLAEFLNADPDGLAFVANATTGVNTVLRSLEFAAGDEILTTDHEYNACLNTIRYVADRSGAAAVVANIPFPLESAQQVVDAIVERVTERTKLAVISHITSPTGLVFPAAQIVAALAQRGVDTLVDGAHTPGMLALDIGAINAAYYTGNAHKWLCTPKGAAFLHVRADRQERIRPLVISHGANSPRGDRSLYRLEADWGGTADPTAFLTIPAALDFMAGLLPGGWAELQDGESEPRAGWSQSAARSTRSNLGPGAGRHDRLARRGHPAARHAARTAVADDRRTWGGHVSARSAARRAVRRPPHRGARLRLAAYAGRRRREAAHPAHQRAGLQLGRGL